MTPTRRGSYPTDLNSGTAYGTRSSIPSISGIYSSAISNTNNGVDASNRALDSNWARKTKLVCTIGPATSSKEEFWKLADAGRD